MLISKAIRDADYDVNPVVYEIGNPENATFQITDTELYVPVVTLSTENDKKLLEQLKAGFKRKIKWNEYKSQMIIQTNNNNFNYLIDPTFTKVNRLFVLSFAINADTDCRDSFSHYYVPNIEVKDFTVLIDWKNFIWIASKKWRRSLRENYWDE